MINFKSAVYKSYTDTKSQIIILMFFYFNLACKVSFPASFCLIKLSGTEIQNLVTQLNSWLILISF